MKNRIRKLREALGLTQEQLAQRIGVSRQAVNAIETGKYEPSIWIAYDLAKAFGCAIEEVFQFEESPRKTRADKSRGGTIVGNSEAVLF